MGKRNMGPQRICDNCRNVRFRNDSLGDVHRFCDMFGSWIPDNEMFPVCGQHDFCKAIKCKILKQK